MTPERLDLLRRTAENIDTGTQSPDTSRALVVFSSAEYDLSGVAVYHADMSWRRDAPLPPIVVTEMDGSQVGCVIGGLESRGDERGRPDRKHISFDLQFAVKDVPANGWKTYLAWFVEEARPGGAETALAAPNARLTVIETTRHGGDLPPRGTF